jgi:hypothetical protein
LLHAERRGDRQTDRQADMTNVTVSFRNFAKILNFLNIYLPADVLRLKQTNSHY